MVENWRWKRFHQNNSILASDSYPPRRTAVQVYLYILIQIEFMRIRLASEDDASGILSIYTPYITNTSFTFETEVPAENEFKERINKYSLKYPWLVCEKNGQIAGYAYASQYRERTAYQWSAECSVYVHDGFQRRGAAQALYSALFAILKRQGFMNVYAVINLPNDNSVALHERMGFTYFATYKKVGYKLGQWKNVGWWRLQLNEFVNEPPAPVSFAAMDKSFLKDIFDKAQLMIKR
jgi:L-amino acid N-acyltransferase YncA